MVLDHAAIPESPAQKADPDFVTRDTINLAKPASTINAARALSALQERESRVIYPFNPSLCDGVPPLGVASALTGQVVGL